MYCPRWSRENGPNYYAFFAGPGHVDLHYAFKEMGVFGNPMRQSLSFDLYVESGQLISHDAIVALEKLERLARPGDLGSRHKLLLRVISPDTTLRLGGYYEIEATGAVAFDGKATGADVQPVDTALYHSGSLYEPGTSLYTPGTSLYTPVGALTFVQDSGRELRLTLAAGILFDFDKATIRPDAIEALDRVAEIIRANSQGTVGIEGFTDSIGRADYNLRLSLARAQSVRNWLAAQERLLVAGFSTRGYGAARFVAPNTKPDGTDDAAGRRKNRHVEITIQKQD